MDEIDNLNKIEIDNGPTLVFSEKTDVIVKDGLIFKNLAKKENFYPYEDWRLDPQKRAQDLASRMTIKQIAGLMIYSSHQSVLNEHLTDEQFSFITKECGRHVLMTDVTSTEVAVNWNNRLQILAEKMPWGIPVNISSDPRHSVKNNFEYKNGKKEKISQWPEYIGLAATFSAKTVKKFAEITRLEYRALGITTSLSPQIDLSTEPRWSRFKDGFGENLKLNVDLTRAFCDGIQTTPGTISGWGSGSVNAMVKHWPGGGAAEAGRDSHFGSGKYAVYPGNNFKEHLLPFTEGAFKLDGLTKKAAAVMPTYAVLWNQDVRRHKNVGSVFNHYLINDLLRCKNKYEGVICTDWGVISDEGTLDNMFTGKSWGVEELSPAQRCYKVLMVGADQFGGINSVKPILEAYKIGLKKHSKGFMKQKFEQSATRLLKNIFQVGLFENPYLIKECSKKIVGNPKYISQGFKAQKKSLVLLKNRNNVLPLKKGTKIYLPKNIEGQKSPFEINISLLEKYFQVVSNPKDAEGAICFISAPVNKGDHKFLRGYDKKETLKGENGYIPISLQYRPYVAKFAREKSIAGGDFQENFTNRSYSGKYTVTENEFELDKVISTKKLMGNKPVIVCVKAEGPCVVQEFEPLVDSIILSFGNLFHAVLESLVGKNEPSGLLPFQIPMDMKAVETQLEDVPCDMESYVDTEGQKYEFAYGMNFDGVIRDQRVQNYKS